MPDIGGTGLKIRLFTIILLSLICSVLGVNFVHTYFYKTQRLKLIDSQILDASNLLLNSKVFNSSLKSKKHIDEAISLTLKGSKIGKIFVINDSNNQIVFESINVSLLEKTLPTEPEWVTIETKSEFVRIRNVNLDKRKLILQVGQVLDRNFIDWEIIDTRLILYIMGFVLVLSGISFFLTFIVMSPLNSLITHMTLITKDLVFLRNVKPLPTKLLKSTEAIWKTSNEVKLLLNSVQVLIDRINTNNRLTKGWTQQMAHELKTPLAIIRAEAMSINNLTLEHSTSEIVKEVDNTAEMISQFLTWASIESSGIPSDIHSVRVSPLLSSIKTRLNKIYSDRISINTQLKESDFLIFANPIHIELVLTNLIENALKYSVANSVVEIALNDNIVSITNTGSEIPKDVLDRFGQPFNLGPRNEKNKIGYGLGLATVASIIKIYNWKITFKRIEVNKTKVSVLFPTETELEV